MSASIFRKSGNKVSRVTLWLLVIALVWTFFNLHQWRRPEKVIENDISFYYGYLPAAFIYHDLTLKYTENPPEGYRAFFGPERAPNGGLVIKTTMGLALLYLPFFLVGHLFAGLLGQVQDGYSSAYCFALLFGSIVYMSAGLSLLRKLLLNWFDDNITALTLLCVFLGTNLFYYSTGESLMTHAYIFVLSIFFIWSTIRWYKRPDFKSSLLLGCISGLMILIRPTTVIITLIFALYDIKAWKDLKQRVFYFKDHIVWLGLILLFVFLVWVPQLIYWKVNTGHWVFFSYQGEKFFLNHPHVFQVLFSYRKGWLLYTPMMLFALVGLPLLWKKVSVFRWSIPIITIVTIYLLSCWWSWWFGGSYGYRGLIDLYAVLSFPLACSIEYFANKKAWRRITVAVAALVLIAFHLFQNLQYRRGIIHYDSMTKAAYWSVFLKLERPHDFYDLLEAPDYENAKAGLPERK
jgi:hypothetical protein